LLDPNSVNDNFTATLAEQDHKVLPTTFHFVIAHFGGVVLQKQDKGNTAPVAMLELASAGRESVSVVLPPMLLSQETATRNLVNLLQEKSTASIDDSAAQQTTMQAAPFQP
jgi:hypothetical protein